MTISPSNNNKTNDTILSLTTTEVSNLKQFDATIAVKDQDSSSNAPQFPIIFNNKDGKSLHDHRLVNYALGKEKGRSFVNRKEKYTVVVKEPPSPVITTTTDTAGPPPVMKKWSDMLRNGSSNSNNNGTTSTTTTRPNTSTSSSSSHTAYAPRSELISSNALQPLGVVSLRIMHDPSVSEQFFTTTSKKTTPGGLSPRPRGLINSGNICYMNSILQILFACGPFLKCLKFIQTRTLANLGSISKTPLLDAVLIFMTSFISTTTAADSSQAQSAAAAAFVPDKFYQSLSKHPIFSHLKWGQQEDAEEFLGYLLDGLHEEFVGAINELSKDDVKNLIKSFPAAAADLKIAINQTVAMCNNGVIERDNHEETSLTNDTDDGWHEVGVRKTHFNSNTSGNKNVISAKRTVQIKPSPITYLFGGQFRSVLEVPRQQRSITLDPFQHVQLDISDPTVWSLEDAFKLLSKPEFISYNTSTNIEVKAKKQTFIDKLPKILIVHLKRFEFVVVSGGNGNTARVEKLHKKLTIPFELSIPLECFSPETLKFGNSNANTKFKLLAIVYHHGVSPEGGHYTCDVLNDNPGLGQGPGTNPGTSPGQENWVRIDDGIINQISKDDVNNVNDSRDSYILMYQQY